MDVQLLVGWHKNKMEWERKLDGPPNVVGGGNAVNAANAIASSFAASADNGANATAWSLVAVGQIDVVGSNGFTSPDECAFGIVEAEVFLVGRRVGLVM